jgi:PAS domain S-box-containing protein
MLPYNDPEISPSERLERAEMALSETQALYHVARTLIGFRDLPALLQTVVDSVAKALPANRVTLITFDLEAHRVTHFVKGGPGVNDVVNVLIDELWDGLTGWVIREMKPALSPKAFPDPRESSQVRRRREETRCGAIIVVPLQYQDTILGTMTAINNPDERDFTQRDVELMMALASHTSIAIENTHLYQELQSANAELERRVVKRTAELAEANFHLQQEIAERDRVAQALRLSEERYRLLVENMNDGLAVSDSDIKLTYVNRRFCDLLGYTRDELIGRSLWSLLDQANQVIMEEHVARRRKGEQSLYELDLLRKDGRRISTLVSGTPLLDDQGTFLGGFAVFTDITERKHAEEKLLASERRLLEAQQMAHLGYWDGDLIHDQTTWSDETYRIFGLHPQQMPLNSAKMLEMVYPEDRHKVLSARADALAGLGPYDLEFRVQCPDGSMRFVHSRGRVSFDTDGRPVRISGTLIDITGRKQAEEERLAHLRFLECLDQVNRAIQGANDLDQMMRDVLDALLSIFDCDRAWLVYPCDPEVAMWQVPMERTRPEYPGVLPVGVELPLEPAGAAIYQILRDSPGPVQFGPGLAYAVPIEIKENFSVQSFIAMALYPKVGKPWAFGLHQCSSARIWTEEEERLFIEISRRLSDALTSLLTYRDLQQSNNLLSTIIEAAPTAIIGLDLDGNIQAVWNPAAEKMLGWSAQEIMGRSLPSVPADRQEEFRRFRERIRRGESLNGIEVRRQRRDGTPIDYSIYASPLKDASGQIMGNIAVLVDITERKQAEAAMQRYNQRLSILREIDRSILNAHSPDRIAHTILEYMIRLIPCEWASIILYDKMLTEERVFASHHTPDIHIQAETSQPVVFNETLERLKSGRSAITPDLRLQEGESAQLANDLVAQGARAAMANPLMVKDRLIGVIALASLQVGFFTPEHQQIAEEIGSQVAIALYQAELNDQIARHNTELEQRVRERTTQLENANRELELFSYSVSHDLRAPLRAIQGFAEIIVRRHRSSLNEEGRHYFDNIVTASQQMDQLIIDLLAYARLGRQRIPHLQPIALRHLLADVITNLAPQIEETGARIRMPQSLPDVDGDRTLLKQIFTNLLQNALTYHQPDVSPIIDVSFSIEADHTIVRIADNGIGIPVEFHEKIFNIFQRLHSHDQYPGTGIGLAIVRKAVEMLNGAVWVESAPEGGSVFCVRLRHIIGKDNTCDSTEQQDGTHTAR